MGTTQELSPAEALKLLLEGNERFVSGTPLHPNQDALHRTEIAPQQFPFAVLFGCSDSRLAAEIIFDRGLGDLFVVRTAGHVIGPEVLGSIEYGVENLGVPLVAVLGHDSCGAVDATLAALQNGEMPTGFVRDIVERVTLSVLAARDDNGDAGTGIGDNHLPDAAAAGEEHVRYTTDLIASRSAAIARRITEGTCAVVGLRYTLSEGSVRIVSTRGV